KAFKASYITSTVLRKPSSGLRRRNNTSPFSEHVSRMTASGQTEKSRLLIAMSVTGTNPEGSMINPEIHPVYKSAAPLV
ncbi:MAG: hypothetical protein VX741_02070, partial [Pseudomonadota bacterium]|nr:hypothetical protein [Pseudomonadota bacterium]